MICSTPLPHNLELLHSSGIQPVVEVSSTLSSSTAINEQHGDHTILASYSTYDLCQNGARWDNGATFDSPRTIWPTSDRQPLNPLVDQEINTLWHNFLNQSSAHPSSSCTSHVTHSHYSGLSNDENARAPFIPHPLPPHQSFSPYLPYCSPPPTSSGFPETDPHSHHSFSQVPRRDPTISSYRRRAARAIEYNWLWIDEEDLLRGLTEPDGKLNIHRCQWEVDHSPCHLWISGDKSSINAHIQKWHGGKPGGEKLQVNCRWPACGKTMLKESIARHIVTIHLGQTWECQGCGKEISRNDSYMQHAARSKLEACRDAGPLITHSPDALEIDARVALDSGGRLRYAASGA